jgi:hypothetical protein
VLIPGFVIKGTGTKRLLIRAVGPTLGMPPFGLGGVLSDPVMVLKKWNGTGYDDLETCDNWRDNTNFAEIENVSAQLYAFRLSSDLDAAMLVDLGPGQYTAVTSGIGGSTGIAIVELYDSDSAATSRMTSISNRGFAGAGDDVMIPGFVISPEGSKTLLLRVVGPTLGENYGVSGSMEDPEMTVFRRASDGSEIRLFSNDNWSDSPDAANTAAVAQQVYAFALNYGSNDAAVVATLKPGVYTVVGSSAIAGGSGVVLVEVYVVE